jgi:hypothetical protein
MHPKRVQKELGRRSVQNPRIQVRTPGDYFLRNLKLREHKRLDAFLTGQPQAKQSALAFKIDMKIEKRAAPIFRHYPLR